jgi:DNA helicase-2/ATP-dependent DNA helicase PcrA
VRVGFHADEEDEGARVAELVQTHTAAGRARSEIAVLYRTNAQSRALEDALRRANVPYQIVGGTRFYERREVRDVVAYLKAIHNPADGVSLARILNVPRRGIGDTTVERLQTLASARGTSLGDALARGEEAGLAAAATRKVAEFAALLVELRTLAGQGTCVAVVQAVLDRTHYLDYLRESDPAGWQARRENVEELVSAAQTFADESTDDPSLRAFLEEISLLSDIDSMEEKVDTVTLMTLHSAKGLEFPVVVITGLEERILPHASNLEDLPGLEEERRLFYVGMTRAEERLHLLSASNRRRFGEYEPMMQSRFLGELPEDAVEFDTARTVPARRAVWAPRQDSWRSYAEGDPDSFWGRQGLDPNTYEERAAAARRDRSAPVRPSPGRPLGFSEDEGSQENVALQVGMRVRHERFGVGQVLRIEGHGEMMKFTVLFGRYDS